MSESEETSEIEEMAGDAVAPIGQELRRRLAIELDDRGVLAIESALLKSFFKGMRAGLAETAEESGIPTGLGARRVVNAAALDSRLPWVDPFAERYGDG